MANRPIRILTAATLFSIALIVVSAFTRSAARTDYILIVNKSDSTLTVVDATTREVKGTVPTGQGPHEVSASPDGHYAYVSNYIGAPGDRGHSITVIDLDTMKALEPIDLLPNRGPHGSTVSADGKWLWVTTEVSKTINKIDLASRKLVGSIETGPLSTHMIVLCESKGKSYSTSIQSGAVAIVDIKSGKLIKQLPTAAGAEGIAISPDNKYVLVSNREAGSVSVIDTATDEIVKTVNTGNYPIRVKVTTDGKHALVSNMRANEIAEIDTKTWEVTRRLPVGQNPVGILLSPDGNTAYVAGTASDKVAIVDLKSWKVTSELSAGREPDGLAYAKRSGKN